MQKFINLWKGDYYLTKKELTSLLEEYLPTYQKIQKRKYLLLFPSFRHFFFSYQKASQKREEINRIFYQKEKEKYAHFFQSIQGYSLDSYQQECVLNEEDALLVIAGAGSGKSLTIVGKVKYLIEEKGILEKRILCLSFTQASSKSLKGKIEKEGYSVEVLTFHQMALRILKDSSYQVARRDSLEYLIDEFYHALLLQIPSLFHLTLLFFQKKKEEYFSLFKEPKFLRFQKNITTFIHLFRANKREDNLLFSYYQKAYGKEEKLFFLHILAIYTLYLQELEANWEIDFDDMLRKATQTLEKEERMLPYQYLIVDEFQDSSLLRVQFLQSILKRSSAKLMVVGDDFQSIYRFTGCNLSTFLHFSSYFPNSEVLFLPNTYRNSQELIQIAGSFMMKNKKQIQKQLFSQKHLFKPIKIIYYQNEKETFFHLLDYLLTKGKKRVLVLGRNQKDLQEIQNGSINEEYPYQELIWRYLTVHQAKGLEEETVILLHLENAFLGFPNQIEESPLFRFLELEQETFAYEEERRLFYVALTRTKGEVYLLTPFSKESIFVKELLRDFKEQIEILSIK